MAAKNPRSLYLSMAWRLFLDVSSRGAFFIVNIVIARSLGVVDFGKFAYATSLSQMFYSFTELGTHLQLAKELGESDDPVRTTWKHFFELKILLLLASLVIFAPIVVSMWHWPNGWIPVAALIWMFSNSLLDFNQFTCNGLARMDLAQNMMLFQRGTVVVGTLASLLISRSLEAVMIGMATGGVVGAVMSNVYFFRVTRAKFSWDGSMAQWKRILQASIPTGIASVIGQTLVRIGPVLLAWVWTSQVVGEYSAAFRIFEITYIVPGAVMAISVSHLSDALRRGRADFIRQFKHVAVVMLPIAAAWSLFLYFGAQIIVKTLFGVKFINAVPVLKILSGVSIFVFLNYLVTHVMVIAGRQKKHMFNMIITAAFGACFFVLLVGRAPGTGVAFASLLTEATLFLVTLRTLWAWWQVEMPAAQRVSSGA